MLPYVGIWRSRRYVWQNYKNSSLCSAIWQPAGQVTNVRLTRNQAPFYEHWLKDKRTFVIWLDFFSLNYRYFPSKTAKIDLLFISRTYVWFTNTNCRFFWKTNSFLVMNVWYSKIGLLPNVIQIATDSSTCKRTFAYTLNAYSTRKLNSLLQTGLSSIRGHPGSRPPPS
jgi:hypothetical protein